MLTPALAPRMPVIYRRGCRGIDSDVRYPKFGTHVNGNKRTTHIWFCYLCYCKEKPPPCFFPPEGIHVRSPPRATHVCCPPRHIVVVASREAFSTRDRRVFLPPGPVPLVESSILKSSIHHSFTFSYYCYHKKSCYPPHFSVTSMLPLPVTYMQQQCCQEVRTSKIRRV